MSRDLKLPFAMNDAACTVRTVRPSNEAALLLQSLRTAYQSLTPDKQCEVKSYMSELLERELRGLGEP